MTYFHMGAPHYHRRGFVSRSCSGWEGVVPKRYGRQTLTGRSRVFDSVLWNRCPARWKANNGGSESVLRDVFTSHALVFSVIGSSRTGN